MFNYWISPSGEKKAVGLWGHADGAFDILREIRPEMGVMAMIERGTITLQEMGWAKLAERTEGGDVTLEYRGTRCSKDILDCVYDIYVQTQSERLKKILKEEKYIEEICS